MKISILKTEEEKEKDKIVSESVNTNFFDMNEDELSKIIDLSTQTFEELRSFVKKISIDMYIKQKK